MGRAGIARLRISKCIHVRAGTMDARSRGGGAAAALLVSLQASPAAAHAFGARYELPVPLTLCLLAAGATVLLTFVMAALYMKTAASPAADRSPRPAESGYSFATPLRSLASITAMLVFILLLAFGFWGPQAPESNVVPTLVWIVWWVGMPMISALLGDVWRFFSPWEVVHDAIRYLRKADRAGARSSTTWPRSLGTWPTVVGFLLFAWMELVWPGRARPACIASAAALYVLVSLAGMEAFGKEAWRSRADVFAVVFGAFARWGLVLRRPTPLSTATSGDPALAVLILVLLSTISFDGLVETPLWVATATPVADWLSDRGMLGEVAAIRVVMSLGLLFSPLAVMLAYGACVLTMRRLAGGSTTAWMIAVHFAATLMPIALAYHFAHYLNYFLVGVQSLLPLSAATLGLVHSGSVDLNLLSTKAQWWISIAVIVIGHSIAVIRGHGQALLLYGDRALAIRSQLPLMALMVGYTMMSLWILAQPIVEY